MHNRPQLSSKRFLNHLVFYSMWIIGWPFYFMPYWMIHKIGAFLGRLAYLCSKKHRKLAMSNLALASRLNLSEKQMKAITLQAFQSLMITTLEYFRIKKSRYRIEEVIEAENLAILESIRKQGKGAIVVTGHYSNWELIFCSYTQNHDGVTVGRPIKNHRLYDWILSIRTMHGGIVLDTKNAIHNGLKALKKGAVFSIVNDQALPESSYAYPLFGRRAWTSTTPALLAYKTGCPIFVVTNHRYSKGKYRYKLSDPIFPDKSKRLKEEVTRIMDQVMKELEDRIIASPGEWLWMHKRWKQEGYERILPAYKYDSYLIILPPSAEEFHKINEALPIFRKMLQRSFISVVAPQLYKDKINLENIDVIPYQHEKDVLIRNWSYQCVFDFSNYSKTKTFYKRLGAFKVLQINDLKKQLPKTHPYTDNMGYRELFGRALCFQYDGF